MTKENVIQLPQARCDSCTFKLDLWIESRVECDLFKSFNSEVLCDIDVSYNSASLL